jgi:hypothetical protein
MNWKGFGMRQSWPNLKYYFGTRLEGLRKTTKKPSFSIAGPQIEG